MFSQSEIALHAPTFNSRDWAYHVWTYAGKIYRSFSEAVYGVGTEWLPWWGRTARRGDAAATAGQRHISLGQGLK